MGCDTIFCEPTCSLPEVDFCLDSPEIFPGQINSLYLSRRGYPFLDVSDEDEWTDRINASLSIPWRIIELIGVGSKDVPALNSVTGAYDKFEYANKIHIVNFSFKEVKETNYQFMRYLEKYRKASMWYRNGNMIYGDEKGLDCEIIFNEIIPENYSESVSISGQVKFTSPTHPCKTRLDQDIPIPPTPPPPPEVLVLEDGIFKILLEDGVSFILTE